MSVDQSIDQSIDHYKAAIMQQKINSDLIEVI